MYGNNYIGGYYCPYCGTFVPNGTYHYCTQHIATPPYTYDKQYNYRCPKCKGEFNSPSTNGTKGFCCPFCGGEMKGLSQ